MSKPYPEEFRRDVVRVARNRGPGVTVEQVARDFGVHPMTLWKWMRRPPAFDKEIYRDRRVVERCFARLKQFRAVVTRFDKLADSCRAGVVMASLILWLRTAAG